MQLLDPPQDHWPVLASDQDSVLGPDWLRWFERVYSATNAQSQRVGSVTTLSSQAAAITSQTLPIPTLASGPTHIHYYLEVTAADSGGSLQVQVGWKHNAKALTRLFPPVTPSTVNVNDSATIPVLVDANSPITYSIAYSSPAGTLRYQFSMWVTQP